MKARTRRELLRIGGSSIAMASLAGCVGSGTPGSDGRTVYTSFFTLYDFTRNVAGEGLTVDNPVPAQQHGHGWEPPTNLLPEIVDADAFVYLDADGFQPWAEQAAAEIEENYADDVVLIDALDGIDLLEYESDHHREYDHDTSDREYGSVAELELIDRPSGQVVANFHFGHWHGSIPEIPPDGHVSLLARFVDGSNQQFPLGEDSPYAFDARLPADASEEILSIASDGDHVRLEGNSAGDVPVIFELREEGELSWESDPVTASVVESEGATQERDHGMYDAKFFSDPVLAQEGVRNIRDGLIELDPANEATYVSNADDYIEQLDDLHQRYRERLADRDHGVAVLAGHDSFNYLATRYGFEIHTPVGLSPEDEPSSSDIAAAVDLVEEREISTVLWDYFDGDRTAEAIVAEANSATGTAMVSAAESYLQEWNDEGYGDYIGQMEQINLPAFEKALGVE